MSTPRKKPGQAHLGPHVPRRDRAPQLRENASRVPTSEHSPADGTGVRLNRYLAAAGLCSRRKADELVAAGRVELNGRPAVPGDRVFPQDRVLVDGRPVTRGQELVCLVLNKPVRVVSTVSDPQGRRTVLDLVPARFQSLRLFPVGRLDYMSEGLLLLTNDGALAHGLMHPRHATRKVYEVTVLGTPTPLQLDTMRRGMLLAEGDRTAPAEIRATGSDTGTGTTLLTVVLRQGLNRQIRRMCRDVGLKVMRLKRVAEGPLTLGDLAPGKVRRLSEAELTALRGTF